MLNFMFGSGGANQNTSSVSSLNRTPIKEVNPSNELPRTLVTNNPSELPRTTLDNNPYASHPFFNPPPPSLSTTNNTPSKPTVTSPSQPAQTPQKLMPLIEKYIKPNAPQNTPTQNASKQDDSASRMAPIIAKYGPKK